MECTDRLNAVWLGCPGASQPACLLQCAQPPLHTCTNTAPRATLAQARFANAVNINWIVAWGACILWQVAFVQQTPGGMWLAFVLILTACVAMGRAQLQLYRCVERECVCVRGGGDLVWRVASKLVGALAWVRGITLLCPTTLPARPQREGSLWACALAAPLRSFLPGNNGK